MNNIPIFDSLTHPTLNGDWLLPRYQQMSKINDLIDEMEANNICNALAVGMAGIGAYDEARYSEFVLSKTDKLLPIAFLNVNDYSDISSVTKKLKYLKSKKYRGIKLHPRIGKFNLLNPFLPGIIKAANKEGLVILLCTYFYDNSEDAINNNVGSLLKLLVKIPDEKIILLHSGTVRLLEIMEIARNFPKVLLDLSFTLNKYTGSSLDSDIRFCFNTFDQKICVGSDFPEFSSHDLRKKFDFLAKNIDKNKAANIAFQNITNFIKN
jgi:predicted TIM-barrel fold metal-dependent hydrolase